MPKTGKALIAAGSYIWVRKNCCHFFKNFLYKSIGRIITDTKCIIINTIKFTAGIYLIGLFGAG